MNIAAKVCSVLIWLSLMAASIFTLKAPYGERISILAIVAGDGLSLYAMFFGAYTLVITGVATWQLAMVATIVLAAIGWLNTDKIEAFFDWIDGRRGGGD